MTDGAAYFIHFEVPRTVLSRDVTYYEVGGCHLPQFLAPTRVNDRSKGAAQADEHEGLAFPPRLYSAFYIGEALRGLYLALAVCLSAIVTSADTVLVITSQLVQVTRAIAFPGGVQCTK